MKPKSLPVFSGTKVSSTNSIFSNVSKGSYPGDKQLDGDIPFSGLPRFLFDSIDSGFSFFVRSIAVVVLLLSITSVGFSQGPVANLTQGTNHMTIQDGVDAAIANDEILVSAGTYAENVIVDKALTLLGANANTSCDSRVAESLIAPASGAPVTITADGVTINGFEMTAPTNGFAVEYSNTSDVSILFNNIHDVGNDPTFGGPPTNGNTVHAVRYQLDGGSYSNIDVSNNCFTAIGHDGNTFNSTSAIAFLQSSSLGTLTTVNITDNSISNVRAANVDWTLGGRIAYGILINVGGNSSFATNGKVADATIEGNTIDDLDGFISTGIGLEGNTENALVQLNVISNLSGSKIGADRSGGGLDLQALKFEKNRHVGTVTVVHNSFATNTYVHDGTPNLGYGVANYVDASLYGIADVTCNWFGTADPFEIQDNANLDGKILNKAGAESTFLSFLVNDDINNPDCSGTGPVANLTQGTSHMTIQDGVDAANANDVLEIQVADFTEPAQAVMDKDLTLQGLGKNATILRPGEDTGTSGDVRGFILVNAGVNFALQDLTIDGTGVLVWQAIRQRGEGSVQNVRFTEIKYNPSTNYQGVAIAAFGTGNVDVSGCEFDEIGRIGVLYFGAGISGSNFTGNTYSGKGSGDWLDYALDISSGAKVNVSANTISGNRGEATVDGSTSAGILVSTFFGPGTEANVANNFISDNTTAVFVGFDASDASTVTVNNNSLTGNDNGVVSTAQTVDATCNWWESDEIDDIELLVSGDVNFLPYLSTGTNTSSSPTEFIPVSGACNLAPYANYVFDPEVITAGCDEFTVTLRIETTGPVTNAEARLLFDPTLLEVVKVRGPGDLFFPQGPLPAGVLPPDINDVLGTISFASQATGGPFPDSDFDYAEITFKTKAAFTSGTTLIEHELTTFPTSKIAYLDTDQDPAVSLNVLKEAFPLTIEASSPLIGGTVDGPGGYSELMTSGNDYALTICSGEEVTSSAASLLNANLASDCGDLRISSSFVSTLPNISDDAFDEAYSLASMFPPTTISPENTTGTNQTITFNTFAYYDSNGNEVPDAGDVIGEEVEFILTVEPTPVISNTVSSAAFADINMISGENYAATVCSGEELTTTIPSTTQVDPASCGEFRIQSEYISNLPNIPSAVIDGSLAEAIATGAVTISPENTTGSQQTITFISTPYYDVDGNEELSAGDIEGEPITFVLTVESALGVTCPADIAVNNDLGLCSASVAFAATAVGTPTPSIAYTIDDPGNPGNALTITSPYVFPVGITEVTATATNSCSVESCTFNVVVTDNELPNVICQNITVQLDAAGSATVLPSQIDDMSTDNCAIDSYELNNAASVTFGCADVGANTVALKVTDIHGNENTCSATVTVEDNVNPVAVCQNITVQLDALGNASITGADINNGSSDACGIASLSVTPNSFDCSDVGANPVTLTVTDNNMNVSTCTATVTVEDNVAPVANCQNFTVQLDATGNASITGADINNSSSDACGIATLIASPNTFDCTNVGPNTVTLTVEDNNGNSSTCSTTVTVQDTEVPTISCPSGITLESSIATDPFVTGFATGADNCLFDITWSDDRTGLIDCNMTGTVLRTFTVTDTSGNSAFCTQTITVVDNIDPELTPCPADISVDNDAGVCEAAVSFDAPTATDLKYAEDFEDSDFETGNSTTLQHQGWNDYTSPMFRVTSGTGGIPSASGSAHAVIDAANSPSFSGVFSRLGGYSDAFGSGFIGQISVYVDLSAASGAANSYGWDVSLAASRQTGAHLRDFIFHSANNAAGNVLIGGSNNSSFSVKTNIASGNNYEITSSGWYILEWDFRDNGSDVLAVDLNLRDASGSLLWTETRSSASDIISSIVGGNRYMWFTHVSTPTLAVDDVSLVRKVEVTFSAQSGDSFPVGTTTVTCDASDACSNGPVSCSFDITVNDTEDPVTVCENIVVQLDASGSVTVLPSEINDGSTDNCGIDTYELNDSPSVTFGCADVGTNTVTLKVTDIHGNSSTCSATVTVENNLAATISCPSNLNFDLDAGQCFATAIGAAASVISNCDDSYTYSISGATTGSGSGTVDGVQFEPGLSTVTYTATQGGATCSFDVFVNPTPSTSSESYAATLDIPVSIGTGIPNTNMAISENCDIEIGLKAFRRFLGDVVPVGAPQNRYQIGTGLSPTSGAITATDPGLARWNYLFSVDLGNYTFNDVDVILEIDFDTAATSSTASRQVIDLSQAMIDNFLGGESVLQDSQNLGFSFWQDPLVFPGPNNILPFDPYAEGIYDLKLTVLSGPDVLASSEIQVEVDCQFVIPSEDIDPPVLTCPVNLSADAEAGECFATFTGTDPDIFTDNCSTNLSYTITGATNTSGTGNVDGVEFAVGTSTVTYIADDGNGNNAVPCSFTVTVTDTQNPTITAPMNVTVPNDPGVCETDAVNVILGTPVADDNCAVATVSNDAPAVFPLGTTTVTWTVEDVNGLTETTTQLVTVEDTEAPVITLTGMPTVFVCEGTSYTDAGATALDNCDMDISGDITVTNPVDINTPGTYTVSYDVSDNAMNAATTVVRTVIVQEEPDVDILFNGVVAGFNASFEYCYDENVEVTLGALAGTEPYDVSWEVNGVPESATLSDGGVLFSDILAAGTYNVQLTGLIDANGCSLLDPSPYGATVTVNPQPDVFFELNGADLLPFDEVEFCYDVTQIDIELVNEEGGVFAQGTPPFNWSATINGGASIDFTNVNYGDVFNVLAELPVDIYGQPVPGSYEIQVTSFTDANGCALSPGALNFYNFTIVINPQPDVFFELNGADLLPFDELEFCYDVNQIDIELVNAQGGVTAEGTAPFNWSATINGGSSIDFIGVNYGDVFDVLAELPKDGFNQPVPGTYEIQVTSFTDANGCVLSSGALNFYNFTVIINPQPDVFFEVDGDPLLPSALLEYCVDVPSVNIALVDEQSGVIAQGTPPFDYSVSINSGPDINFTGVQYDDSFDVLNYIPLDGNGRPVPGDYVIEVTEFTDASGCVLSSGALNFYNFTVRIHQDPEVNIAVNSTTLGFNTNLAFCYDEPLSVTLSDGPAGVAPYDFSWELLDAGNVIVASGSETGFSGGQFFNSATPGATYGAGNYTFNITALVDGNGCTPTNLGDYTADIEIYNDLLLTVPSNITQANDVGVCGANGAFTASASGGAPGWVISFDVGGSPVNSGDFFDVGLTTVNVTAVNDCGTLTGSFDIQVNDAEKPVVNCASDDSRFVDQLNNTYQVQGSEFDPTVSDNCTDAVDLLILHNAGSLPGVLSTSGANFSSLDGWQFPEGSTAVTFTVTDQAGNSETCEVEITVEPQTLTANVSIIASCTPRDVRLEVYPAGGSASTLVATFISTVNSPGDISIALSGVAPGSYDLYFKIEGYLQRAVENVLVSGAGPTVNVTNLLGGDIAGGAYPPNNNAGWNGSFNDDIVNSTDLSLMIAHYNTVGPLHPTLPVSPQYNERGNLNCDFFVDALDLSFISFNYFAVGQKPAP